jgi:hypothetical protein
MLEKVLRGAGTLLASQDMKPVLAAGAEPFAAPAWVVGLVGAAVVLSGLLYFLWRMRSSRRTPRGPTSVRPAATKVR